MKIAYLIICFFLTLPFFARTGVKSENDGISLRYYQTDKLNVDSVINEARAKFEVMNDSINKLTKLYSVKIDSIKTQNKEMLNIINNPNLRVFKYSVGGVKYSLVYKRYKKTDDFKLIKINK